MIEEMSKSAYEFETTKQYQSHLKRTLEYFKGKIHSCDVVLDLGARNPLTDAIKAEFNPYILNTEGDLDDHFAIPDYFFDKVIYSHTIEHQFNPLYTLQRVRSFMKSDATMYILLPERGKLLWCKGHFHEIDEYRMRLLMERAGLEILSKTRQKVWRQWWFYFTGIRPLMRLFIEYHVIYEVKLKQ